MENRFDPLSFELASGQFAIAQVAASVQWLGRRALPPIKRLIAKVQNDAFETALGGGKHSGFLKNYAGKSAAELRSGIRSLERQIASHRNKIADPSQHIKNFHKLDPRQQKDLLTRKWPADIQRQQEQMDILRGMLERSGGGL